MSNPICWWNLRNLFDQNIQKALTSRKWGIDKLDKVGEELKEKFVNKQRPSLRRQNKNDGQLILFNWNCTISGFNFTETKFILRPAYRDSTIGCMTACLITWRGHVTWSHGRSGYKYPALNQKWQLFAPAQVPNYPRLNSFTLNFKVLFSSCFTNSCFPLEWTKLF